MNEKRIAAGIIDFMLCTVIQFCIAFPIIVLPILTNHTIENKFSFDLIFIQNLYITLFTMIIFIFRDIIGSKSLGKRIMKLEIIDAKTGANIIVFRRILRNLTWFIWPVDIAYFFITGNRLGDKIVITTVKSID